MSNNVSLLSNDNQNASDAGNEGSIIHYMDTFLSVVHLVCAFIGFPLNLLVISFILHSRRLHKPRNIVWLGIAFSNILILLNRSLEFCAFVLQDRNLCRIFVFMVGLPYASLLLNLFLALVDRYISITYASWYRRKVRMCYIIVGQIIAFSLLVIVTKFSYVFQFTSVDCHVNSTNGIEVAIVIHILITLCITGQIVVYYKTKKYLSGALDIGNPPTEITLSIIRSPEIAPIIEEGANLEIDNTFVNSERTPSRLKPSAQHHDSQGFLNKDTNSFFVRIGNQSISRLELEAARNLTAGIISLSIFAFPSFVLFAIGMGCVHLFSDVERCSAVAWASAYTSELNLFITIYNPIYFIVRCRDFSEALRQSFSSFRMIDGSRNQ